jgi:hypothetical protein
MNHVISRAYPIARGRGSAARDFDVHLHTRLLACAASMILVVDGREASAHAVQHLLRHVDPDALWARSGDEALATLELMAAHAVVVEAGLEMPVDATDFLRAVAHRFPRTRRVLHGKETPAERVAPARALAHVVVDTAAGYEPLVHGVIVAGVPLRDDPGDELAWPHIIERIHNVVDLVLDGGLSRPSPAFVAERVIGRSEKLAARRSEIEREAWHALSQRRVGP